MLKIQIIYIIQVELMNLSDVKKNWRVVIIAVKSLDTGSPILWACDEEKYSLASFMTSDKFDGNNARERQRYI